MLRVDRATKEKKGVEIRTEGVGKVKREGGGGGYRGKEGAVPELCSRVQSTKTSKTSCLHLKS